MTGAPEREELEETSTATASDFDLIERRSLTNSAGLSFRDFKATLKPRFLKVWADLLPGHLALVALLAGTAYAQARLPVAAALAAACVAALFVGFALAYIELFFHEAAHYNIAPTRAWNDLLANIFLGAFIGQDIAQYRTIHFDHHRYLGTTRDTERSYFAALTPGFILASLTGIRVLMVILVRQRAAGHTDGKRKGLFNAHLLVGVALHGALLGLLLWRGQWAAALAWCGGVAVAMPFFGAVRQVLEHRSEQARPDVDYATVDQGPTNRMFGDGPLASTLGGAGFNRHLLHHWEPQISYTRLRELERYLLDTSAAAALDAHRATYLGTFAALLRSSGAGLR